MLIYFGKASGSEVQVVESAVPMDFVYGFSVGSYALELADHTTPWLGNSSPTHEGAP